MSGPTMIRFVHRFIDHKIAFLRDERGVSAVEFALVLPMMITLYIDSVEISSGVATDRKLGATARTLADLVSQSAAVNQSDIDNIFAATSAVMRPYSDAPLTAIVSAVDIDANGNAKVAWSKAKNTGARAKNSSVTLPPALAVPNTQMIWSEVKYTYTPVIGYVVTGAINLSDQSFSRPRQGNKVVCTTC